MPAAPTPAPEVQAKSRPRMSTRNRLLFFATGWLIVLMPFLFWWNTWFGRHLSNHEISQYLRDDSHPRHIQHALVQVGERMAHHDPAISDWYSDLVRLSSYRVEEVRNTDAWVMGQDTSGTGFHQALLGMLHDPALTVRGNAALSLVRFGDATGRPQIAELLQPAVIPSPESGKLIDAALAGTAIHQDGTIAKLQDENGNKTEVRSPITGRLREVSVPIGQNVAPGAQIAVVNPGTEQVWEALRALYVVGQTEDIADVLPYERDIPEVPDRVREQAVETEKAIRSREK